MCVCVCVLVHGHVAERSDYTAFEVIDTFPTRTQCLTERRKDPNEGQAKGGCCTVIYLELKPLAVNLFSQF